MNNFITGDKTSMAYQQIVGLNFGPVTVLSIKGMSLDEECIIADVSHTRTASRTARIAGKGDHKGTINATFDLDAKPYFPIPNIRATSVGLAVLGFDPRFPIQIPCIIPKTHYEMTIEQDVKYSFDFAENVLAGVIVYPSS